MKGRSILLLAISVVLGVLAIGLVRGMNVQQAPVVAKVDTKKLVVTTTTLKFGDKISPLNLKEVDFLPDSVPEGAFASIAEITAGPPRVVLETIRAGEPVLASEITGSGGRASLSSVISQDMRATTIRVDDVSGTAGFILPSDHVDVMLTHSENNSPPQTDVLLQDIKVLAIDQEANERNDKPTVVKAVTLEVTPDQAQKISLARTIGTLSLALRNIANNGPLPTHPITISDLTGVPPPVKEVEIKEKPPRPAPARSPSVEIIRGSAGTVYTVAP